MSGWSVTKPHCSWASLLETFYQYLVPTISPVTDNLLFLNHWKRENTPQKNVTGERVDFVSTGYTKPTCYRPSYHTQSKQSCCSLFGRTFDQKIYLLIPCVYKIIEDDCKKLKWKIMHCHFFKKYQNFIVLQYSFSKINSG